jgi:hypothetical protein
VKLIYLPVSLLLNLGSLPIFFKFRVLDIQSFGFFLLFLWLLLVEVAKFWSSVWVSSYHNLFLAKFGASVRIGSLVLKTELLCGLKIEA